MQEPRSSASAAPPVFTVVIPTFDRADILPRAVSGVLAQTFSDFELIIVDDGSTDDTPDVVRRFNDPRIRYLRQDNQGVCAARNNAIRSGAGDYVTFLDSDDEVEPTWLERFMDEFRRGRVGVVSCGAVWVNVDSGKRGTFLPFVHGPAFDYQPGMFLAGTFAARREILRRIGGYVEELAYAENSELAMRLVPFCLREGFELRTVAEPLHRRNIEPAARRRLPARAFTARLHAARYILGHHGERVRRDRKMYANYRAVAGVNAIRLGRYGCGRKHLRAAAATDPWRLMHLVRLVLATWGPLARRIWLRHGQEDAGR